MYMLLWMPGRTTPIGLFNYYIMIDTIISIVLIVIGSKITEMDMLNMRIADTIRIFPIVWMI